MADYPARQSSGVPNHVPMETTNIHQKLEKIPELDARLNSLEKSRPDTEWVRNMVTQARQSIEQKATIQVDKAIEAVVTDVEQLASKASVENLEKQMAEHKLPSGWKMISSLIGAVIIIVGFLMNAQTRVSDLATQNMLLKSELATQNLIFETRFRAFESALKRTDDLVDGQQRTVDNLVEQLIKRWTKGAKP